MELIIALFVTSWIALSAIKLKFSLHMIQIEGYDSYKYLEWVSTHKDKVYTDYDKIYLIISLINSMVFLIVNKATNNSLLIFSVLHIIIIAVFLYLNFSKKYEAKKPLVFTQRAKRLYMASISLLIADLLIVLVAMIILKIDMEKKFVLWAGILAVIYYFSSYYMAGAALVMKPIENNINKKFYNLAMNKIKNMKSLTSVGITGSYGKTSAKFITATILKEKFTVLNTPESYNTPMGLSKIINNELKDTYDVFVAELGATHIGDIDEVAKLTNPKIGIITSIGPCHLESFKSIDNIMRTKYELIENLPDNGIAIFNYDNEYVKKLADKTFKEKVLYGIKNTEDVDIFATDLNAGSTGSTFTLCVSKLGTIECTTKLLGEHNILNILAGVAVATSLGMSLEEIREGIEKIEPVEHRLELIDAKTGVLVIDDSFNSNPDGAKAALDVLDSFNGFRKIIVTPGMIELGELEEVENEKFGKNIARVCDIAILVGQNRTLPIQKGIETTEFDKSNLYVVNSLSEATQTLAQITKAGDVVLFENDLPDTYNEN